MKKVFALIVAVCMFLTFVSFATEDAPETDTWYEVVSDEMGRDVLNIWLDSNPSTGFEWQFEFSEPALIESIAGEYVPDETEGILCGSGGVWKAAFAVVSGEAGSAELMLKYMRPWEEAPIDEKTIRLDFDENGRIMTVEEIMPENTPVPGDDML